MTENRQAVLTGNMALAMGGAAAGVKFYCAYPMSPSTGVLHWMAAHARKAGIMVRQVEDEIGVINMAIGAAHAGCRAMCATSGGGFALMTEGLGMSAMIETPVVVIDVQRAGPSTGVPTKTEQGDLWQMLGRRPRRLSARDCRAYSTSLDCFKIIPEDVTIWPTVPVSRHRAHRPAAIRRHQQRWIRPTWISMWRSTAGELITSANGNGAKWLQALSVHGKRCLAARHTRRAGPHAHRRHR